MGRLSDELRKPWGAVVAGVAGGVSGGAAAAAGGPSLALGIGVGAAVYVLKVAVGARGSERPPEPRPAARPRYGTPAFAMLKRADAATRSLEDMARQAGSATATDAAVKRAAEEARGILLDMQRLGGQSAAVLAATSRVDAPGLDAEAAELQLAASQAPGDASAQQSSQASIDRLAVRDRLQRAGRALDGRLQASALGLEALVARVAELSATANAVGEIDPTAQDLAQLTADLDGLRMGLADAEQVARKALGAAG
jgi:hypothetical protein